MKKAQPMTSGIRIPSRGFLFASNPGLVSVQAKCSAFAMSRVDSRTCCATIADRRAAMGPNMAGDELGPGLLDRWALHYLGRYASSAENLRRVLMRRVRRRFPGAA